ncbi:MAG: hypothetical protein HRU20_05275 [Pseudomonadales bacterium]|nr:hypothetical protein [Pseudomonadales bacterium]
MTRPSEKNNRKILMLIMGLPLILMLLSYTLIYLIEDKKLDLVSVLGTKTIGILVKPLKPIVALHLSGENGLPFDFSQQSHKWTLLVLNSPSCGERCANNLIQSRQMHIAMGKEQSKMRRYQLYLDAQLEPSQLARMKEENPQVVTVYSQLKTLKNLLADQDIADWNDIAYLLVDKRGWIMMFYNEAANERDIMKKDLHHLFKYAQ